MKKTTTAKVSSIILSSCFPDKEHIKFKSLSKRKIVNGTTYYYVNTNNLVAVEFPNNMFSYDSKTKTLYHLDYPRFELRDVKGSLEWIVSDECESDINLQEHPILWYHISSKYEFFKRYIIKENLVPYALLSSLRWIHHEGWINHPHPDEYPLSDDNKDIHCLVKLSPRYKIRFIYNHFEVIDAQDSKTAYIFAVDCIQDLSHDRFVLCL